MVVRLAVVKHSFVSVACCVTCDDDASPMLEIEAFRRSPESPFKASKALVEC